VVVLTNVGLEHTRWLGPTITDIAREKLDVVGPGAVLVVGEGLHPEARGGGRGGLRGARRPARGGRAGSRRRAAGRRDVPAAELRGGVRGRAGLPRAELDPEAVAAAAASTRIPGRFEQISSAPVTILDGAHNPAGTEVLAASLRAVLGGRPLAVACSVLDDKDAAAMLRDLLPLTAELVCTSTANPRTLPAATLASLAVQLGHAPERVRIEPDPVRALAAARRLAGVGGVALATGSLYLLADLLRAGTGRAASTL
jgi:dihydrofolate synthase/folylpolyglutamate synthase